MAFRNRVESLRGSFLDRFCCPLGVLFGLCLDHIGAILQELSGLSGAVLVSSWLIFGCFYTHLDPIGVVLRSSRGILRAFLESCFLEFLGFVWIVLE